MLKSGRVMRRLAILTAFVGLAAMACSGGAEPAAEAPTAQPTSVAASAPTPRPEQSPTSVAVPSPTATTAAPEATPTAAAAEVLELAPTGRTGDEILAPELVGLQRWINSEELTLLGERGNVVLIDFWTYTCINCIRTLPYLKEWHGKYVDQGLVIIGVHAPEFEFEKSYDNVVMAAEDHELEYAIVQDNEHQTWRAFENRFWPAKYLIDKDGYIRYTHFGEGNYVETEEKIRELLAESGSDVASITLGAAIELQRDERSYTSNDPYENQTRELYAGASRNYGALSSGSSAPYVYHQEYYEGPDRDILYQDPGDHRNHFIYLQGSWYNGFEELVHSRETENYEDYIAVKFSAIEANVVMSLESDEPYEVRVTIDGGPLDPAQAGEDIMFDEDGNSFVLVGASDMYRVVLLPEYGSHELRLSSNSPRFAIFAYTFGSYLDESGS